MFFPLLFKTYFFLLWHKTNVPTLLVSNHEPVNVTRVVIVEFGGTGLGMRRRERSVYHLGSSEASTASGTESVSAFHDVGRVEISQFNRVILQQLPIHFSGKHEKIFRLEKINRKLKKNFPARKKIN